MLPDLRQNCWEIVPDFVVGEAQDMDATTQEGVGALDVVVLLVLMYGAVNFDDEPGGVAVEVGEEALDDLLPAELETVQSMAAQVLPKNALSWCHPSAELPCQRDLIA